MQPFLMVRDLSTDEVFRVAGDGQSKVLVTSEVAQLVDLELLRREGATDTEIIEADGVLGYWLHSIPTV